jgi:hypothetical protein
MSGQLAAELPDHLANTRALIQRAFPNGVPEGDYLPLLSALSEGMSNRAAARVLSSYTGTDYAVVFNDLLRAQTTDAPSLEEVERVKQRLLACGYKEWLAEPA